ncbi:HlyD family efflux transporter periplasmic adaptor subunit [Hyphomicrobium sp. D-2]|uniref:HlyD family secretion protein n=1 Tax=Hyphomicrobium sp. D-2 TaxID=3041621 RepID=UPI0024561694|nr:HlyD family efflux transporter periplasmic adaptor subunit [Hyphomicrobium sp. D-2]MDH4980905.1 efflux RND transporter periplasmic adaptor subunit [Hyphomicrobium sp. D-2]
MFKALAAALLIALAVLGYVLAEVDNPFFDNGRTHVSTAPTPEWVAAAPGRVEPGSGEVRIGAAILGQVYDVTVSVNDVVEEGELLIRLDDDEARARLAATEAQEGLSRRRRDAQTATPGREDVTSGEDEMYSAEREAIGARFALDEALAGKRRGEIGIDELAKARSRLNRALYHVERQRKAYAAAQAKDKLPAPNEAESALTAARAEVALAATLLDKTRIRTPRAGTVLQLRAKIGEIVAPSPEQPLAVVGDMSVVRVKAELDDGDVAKVKVGQKAFVRSINYPGHNFEGTVAELSPTMATPRVSPRGPRRPSDIEVLEMTINLEGKVPLLPGMRVEAFIRPTEQAAAQ